MSSSALFEPVEHVHMIKDSSSIYVAHVPLDAIYKPLALSLYIHPNEKINT
jgi:hypothetical protein